MFSLHLEEIKILMPLRPEARSGTRPQNRVPCGSGGCCEYQGDVSNRHGTEDPRFRHGSR